MLLNSCFANALVLPHQAIEDSEVHDATNKSSNTASIFESNSAFQNYDLLNDVDDNDEYDFDENHTIFKQKFNIASVPSLKYNLLTVDLIGKTSCYKIYNYTNFSRLPRFNYIWLGVFRI